MSIKILNHRDFVLTLSLVAGLILGDSIEFLSEISLYLLMLAMVASTVNFSFKSWKNPSNLIKSLAGSLSLNYLLTGILTVTLAWLFFYKSGYESLWVGFIIIVAAPPGPAVVPFTTMLKGDINYSTTGLFGLFLVAIVLTPSILLVFLGTSLISPLMIMQIMLQLIIIPLILSRFLRHPKILPYARRTAGTATKWLFFLIIAPIIGMNREVFFQEPFMVLRIAAVFVITMFLLAAVYNYVMAKITENKALIISSTFVMTIKSAAFAAVLSTRFFEGDPVVAMPAAVLSIFIILFAIVYSFFVNKKLYKIKP